MEFTSDRQEPLAKLIEAARKSLALDGADSIAHVASSLAALWTKDYELAIWNAREAVRLNPSGSTESISMGAALDFAGKPQEGVAYLERSLRLSPRPNNMPVEVFVTMLARLQLSAGQFEAAVESSKRALQSRPDFFEACLIQASALAHLGRQSEASAAYARARDLRPKAFALPASWGRYRDAIASRNILDGLRKAGWEG